MVNLKDLTSLSLSPLAGSCATSDTLVERDAFYNGKAKMERASVVSRIAPTFLRFGSFEIFKTRDPYTGRVGPSVGRLDLLHQLVDFTIEMYYPEVGRCNAVVGLQFDNALL